jgi:hypothetical protein
MDRLTDIAELLFLSRHRLTNNRSDYRDCHADSSDMVTPEFRSGSMLDSNLGFFSQDPNLEQIKRIAFAAAASGQ